MQQQEKYLINDKPTIEVILMKSVIVISLILLAGLTSAYTPEQQTILDGMNISFKLCAAYEKVLQGQNVAEYNANVDEYNEWIRQHFGEDANLLKSKLIEPSTEVTPSMTRGDQYLTKPFNSSSALSQFGKQDAYALPFIFTTPMEREEDISQDVLRNF